MTAEAKMAANQLSRLVHLPCTSTTSIRPMNADAIETEIIIANSVVGRHRCTNPQMGATVMERGPILKLEDRA